MTKAQQTLKEDIEKIKDDATIEKVRIYLYKHTRKVIPIYSGNTFPKREKGNNRMKTILNYPMSFS